MTCDLSDKIQINVNQGFLFTENIRYFAPLLKNTIFNY
ncbi:MAG: hypothetical protein FD170_3057 [Bacteroidetes bacterium]|nr:MAG: hypothetical protein FD170_3057 [Bacteroidota bacterium]